MTEVLCVSREVDEIILRTSTNSIACVHVTCAILSAHARYLSGLSGVGFLWPDVLLDAGRTRYGRLLFSTK